VPPRNAWETSESVIVQLNVYKEEKEEDKKQLKIWSVRRGALSLSLLITTRRGLTINSHRDRVSAVSPRMSPRST
jgi:hypothetical protein